MTMATRKRRSQVQVVRKLATADRLSAEGNASLVCVQFVFGLFVHAVLTILVARGGG